MNRNILWGTLSFTTLLVLTGLVLLEEASSISSTDSSLEKVVSKQLIASESSVRISQLVSANNRFGFKLFARLDAASPSSNIFISPQSIAIALAILRNGTADETKAELTKVMELELPLDIDASYSKLITTWNSGNNDVDLAIANSLWMNRDIAIEDEFIDTTQDSYRGIAANLDFADVAAKDTINRWVASNTNHQITEIVDTVSPSDAFYLINAIYFKGSWTNEFNHSKTTQKPFLLTSGATKPVAMMSQTGDYRYYENDRFQAIRLPYGEQAELGMYIFLPQPDSSLQQFNQQLNLENWQEWLSQMRSQSGKITLPKFKLEYDTELKEVLGELGLSKIFNAAEADFSGITDSSLALDTVKHKAVIRVDESGTEAAGVTSVGVRITSAMPQQGFELNVDRPFFFAIRDDITESILFMGNVVEP